MTAPSSSDSTSSADVSVQDYAAFLAIDWADQKHDLLLCPSQNPAALESSTVPAQELQNFFSKLRLRFPQGPIAVFVEAHRGALFHQLMSLEYVHLFPLN